MYGKSCLSTNQKVQLSLILNFWSGGKRENIYIRACEAISFVTTSIPSERLFNTTGNVISSKRNKESNVGIAHVTGIKGQKQAACRNDAHWFTKQ